MTRRKRIIINGNGRTDWRACRYCGKTRLEENSLSAGDGQRWYCGERHLRIGEREFKGRRR